jgi:hypothetical protein
LQPEDPKLIRALPVISNLFVNPLAVRLKREQEAKVSALASPVDNPWLTQFMQEYQGKILFDGSYFRVFAIQYVANKNSSRYPCWEATTEPVFEDDNGAFVVHERHFATASDGRRTLLKASMVGFALAEYSNGTFNLYLLTPSQTYPYPYMPPCTLPKGDDADPVRLTYADECHTRFLHRQARRTNKPTPSARKRTMSPRTPSARSSQRRKAVPGK